MKRRQFVSTVAMLGLPASAALAYNPHPGRVGFDAADCILDTFLADKEGVCKLGMLYRSQFPAEDNYAMLTRSLSGIRKRHRQSDVFADAVTKDFDQGDTVLLDGWVSSRTEARQAALYSFIHS